MKILYVSFCEENMEMKIILELQNEIYEDFVGFAQKVAQGIDLNTILNEE